MLNRLTINSNIAYLYEHLLDFDYKKYYEFIKTNRVEEKLDFSLSIPLTEIYNKALFANKDIDIETQTELVSDNYEKFKEYLIKNNLYKDIKLIIDMMDVIFNTFKDEILSREPVKKTKKGYK